jgi:hypothetical protein
MKDILKCALYTVLVLGAVFSIYGVPGPPPMVHAAPLQNAMPVCDTLKPVSSASSLQVITAGNSNNFIYVCGYNFGSIGGSTFSIVEGTGTTCATNTLALSGGTTAAAGIGLSANGVVNFGSGSGMVLKTAVAGDNVCIIMAGTGPLAGAMTWTSANF